MPFSSKTSGTLHTWTTHNLRRRKKAKRRFSQNHKKPCSYLCCSFFLALFLLREFLQHSTVSVYNYIISYMDTGNFIISQHYNYNSNYFRSILIHRNRSRHTAVSNFYSKTKFKYSTYQDSQNKHLSFSNYYTYCNCCHPSTKKWSSTVISNDAFIIHNDYFSDNNIDILFITFYNSCKNKINL